MHLQENDSIALLLNLLPSMKQVFAMRVGEFLSDMAMFCAFIEVAGEKRFSKLHDINLQTHEKILQTGEEWS